MMFPILDAIRAAEHEELSSRDEAIRLLETYEKYQQQEFAIGNYVERNEIGVNTVRYPEGNQVAKVAGLEVGFEDDGDFYDMQILVALRKNVSKIFTVQRGHYKKCKEGRSLIAFPFKKRKRHD